MTTLTRERLGSSLGKYLQSLLEENPPVSKPALIFWGAFVTIFYCALWSPWWYPLSDSALYLTLARAIAGGRGFTNMGEVHQLARPLVPYLIAGIIKLGGGIGAIQAVMIALMLLAHALIFLTLRRWLPERMALIATLGGAVSYWVFLNALTIMTEPLFLVMFWGGLLALSYVPQKNGTGPINTTANNWTRPAFWRGESAGRQWLMILIALALFISAWDTRVAVAEMLPGVALGLWLMCRQTPVGRRLLWLAIYSVIFGVLVFQYLPVRAGNLKSKLLAMFGQTPTTAPATGPTTTAVVDTGGEDEGPAVRSEHYRFLFLHGMTNPAIELPITGGRWVCEGLAAASEYIFPKFDSGDTIASTQPALDSSYPDPKPDVPQTSSRIIHFAGGIFAVLAMLLFMLGWLGLLARRSWWVACVAIYFIPIWLQWGERLKPRYMIPIAPLLFIILWAGLAIVAGWIAERWKGQTSSSSASSSFVGIWSGIALLAMVMAVNAPPYAVEFYIRRLSPEPFYAQVRRGAFSELVDISGYLQKNAEPDTVVWVNHGAMRRVIAFMSGRRVQVYETFAATNSRGSKLTIAGHLFLNEHVPRDAHYAIVFSDRFTWPEWHLPLEPRPHRVKLSWWTLWERQPGGVFVPVDVPRDDGRFIQGIPPSEF